MLRKGVLMSVPLLAAVPVKIDSDKSETTEKNAFICKPSDLPLYRKDVKFEPKHKAREDGGMLQDGVSAVRVEVQSALNVVCTQKKQLDKLWDEGKAKTKFAVDYLNQEDNTAPRIGAIGLGGLSGYIFGLRGGFFRRTIYGAIGAGIIASICYPKEAEMYAQHGLVEAKKYAKIGYNFAYGIKPGDDVNGPEFPKIPTNLSELGDSLKGIAKSAKDAVFSDKK